MSLLGIRTRRSRGRTGLLLALSALVAAGAALLSGAPAVAADNGAWSVAPTPPAASSAAPRSYFVLEGEPKTTLKDSLRIQNLTKKSITFTIYGADGFNTEKGGFFALKGNDEPQVDAGSWVRLPVTTLTVAARTQVDVPFTIKIPKNATPGDHAGGLVAMNNAIEGTDDSGGFDVGVQRAVAARLYVRVAGATTPGIEVSNVKLDADRGAMPWTGSGNGTVTYTVENTGNLRVSPTSTVTLTGLGGRELDTVVDKSLIEVLPGQRVTMTTKVSGVPWTDRVVATVKTTTAEGAQAEASDTIWLTPWPGFGLGLLLILGLGTFFYLRHTAARRGMKAAESAPRIDIPVSK
jgi:hypothetical protein